MAEFVEVGGADFVGEDGGVACGKIPEVVQIENDARGRVGGVGIGFEAAGAFKEAEEVGLETLVEHGLVGSGLVQGDDGFRGGAEFGGQAGANFFHAVCRQLMKIGLHVG